ANPVRLESDRLRDPLSRPDLVLAFFGIRAGMTVLDLFSGGGYYTEIISNLVGTEGSVIAQNNEAYLAFAAADLGPRFDDNHLANVTRITVEANDLDLPPASLDAVIASLTWHDFYNADPAEGWPAIDEPELTAKLCAAVKPGGVLGVIDHVATAGSDPHETAMKLHRIDPARIKADLADSCFGFEGEINVLRNPEDDLNKPMSDPAIRGRTDRVVYKFRRTD
ncbi:MAG: methyltransferase domain-containing protein, partial [Lysobacterales bacterium]